MRRTVAAGLDLMAVFIIGFVMLCTVSFLIGLLGASSNLRYVLCLPLWGVLAIVYFAISRIVFGRTFGSKLVGR